MSARGTCFRLHLLAPSLAPCTWLPAATAEMHSFTEVDSICIPNNKCSSQMIVDFLGGVPSSFEVSSV